MSGPWFWGIDVSTEAVDLGIITAAGLMQHVDTLMLDKFGGDRARSFAKLYSALPAFFNEWAQRCPPTVIVVEDPYVAQGDQSWIITVLGFTQGAARLCTDAVTHAAGPPVWKKSCGFGGAKKPQIMAWARSYGYEGHRQDHADALGIAQHARELYRLATQHGDIT